jgi:hypothetical protein
MDFCKEHFPKLFAKILSLHERLSAVFPEALPAADRPPGDALYFKENILKALKAADDFESDVCLDIIKDLQAYDFGEQNNQLLDDALSALNDFNIGEVLRFLKQISID